ncbi:hypothetical protein Vretimale_4631 [Volvox reticuliferus]|uniref:Uncharacterized protein n=1 Tax=Volvox reticuliferus TaxID=1737510 RepID=A0A8J4G4F4_9CHLO|nr:hypothetical protein Vretimale_4631 [Volvox reticuliferus]
MVRGATLAGGLKEDIQLAAFLALRGWQVAFCIEATAELWRAAVEIGVLEEGGCALSLKRRWPFQPSKLLVQQIGLIEEFLVKMRIQQATASQWAMNWTASGALPGSADGAQRVQGIQDVKPGHTRNITMRMLDVGCGSGRDLSWLATRSSVVRVDNSVVDPIPSDDASPGRATNVQVMWKCVGLDSWHGALQRTAEVLTLGDVPPGPVGVMLYLVQIGPGPGKLRPLPLPVGMAKTDKLELLRRYLADTQDHRQETSCTTVGPACDFILSRRKSATGRSRKMQDAVECDRNEVMDASALGRFDLLVSVRFLERSFLPTMAELLNPGGVILISTFVDGPGLRTFGRPQSREHVLQPDELAKCFFGPEQGFEVLRDDIEAISDGREARCIVMGRQTVKDRFCQNLAVACSRGQEDRPAATRDRQQPAWAPCQLPSAPQP